MHRLGDAQRLADLRHRSELLRRAGSVHGRGPQNFTLWVESQTTGGDLGAGALSDDWSIVVNTGTMVPRVAAGIGNNLTYTRTPEAGGTYQMTIAGNPVEYNNNTGCDFSTAIPTCPFQASSDYAAYFQVQVGDYTSRACIRRRRSRRSTA